MTGIVSLEIGTSKHPVTAFSSAQIEMILLVVKELVGDPRFSVKRVAKKSNGKFTRKDITQTIKHYGRYQQEVREALVLETVKGLHRNKRLILSVDDTLVKKRGKTIHGTSRWYDHCLKTSYTAFCIVDLALIAGGKVILVLPWLVVKEETAADKTINKKTRKNQEQNIKSRLALQLLERIIPVLIGAKWRPKRIQITMDSWFSSKPVLDRMRKRSWNYRIDGKKNYQVQEVDHDRVNSRGKPKRGPPYKHFVKYVPLEQRFGDPSSWHSFTCPFTGRTVRYKARTVTLKTGGRVRVYAYQREGCKNPRYILTNAIYKHPPSEEIIYRDYYHRWPIEEAHRDLKQQFGLGSFQQRKEELVDAFIQLVYTGYSVFCWTRFRHQLETTQWVTTPAFQDEIRGFINFNPSGNPLVTATS